METFADCEFLDYGLIPDFNGKRTWTDKRTMRLVNDSTYKAILLFIAWLCYICKFMMFQLRLHCKYSLSCGKSPVLTSTRRFDT